MQPDPLYLVDSNVLLEAANAYYAFDQVPSFWAWLGTACDAGPVATISLVEEEIEFPPELVEWIAARDGEQLYVDVSDPEIQSAYQTLAQWIIDQPFGPEHIAKFLNGADLWLIAAAMVTGAAVVTQEKGVGVGSRKIKIPDVCAAFGVRCVDTFIMMKELDAAI